MVWLDSVDAASATSGVLQYLPKDPNLCGASIVVLWKGVDKGPGATPSQYDFNAIEKAIAPWRKAHKLVNLLFVGANEVGTADTDTPAWVLNQSGSNTVDIVSPCPSPGTGGNAGPPTPVYWEQGYRVPWRAFIAAIVKQYGRDPRIGYMRFGLGAGAEDFPQHGADYDCAGNWAPYGLTAKFWAAFSASLVRYIAQTSRANNATVQQIVAINPFHDSSNPFNVQDRVAYAAVTHGVGFGTENLGSGNYGTKAIPCTRNAPPPYWCHAYQTYGHQVPLEFQPIDFTLDAKVSAPLPQLLPYAMLNNAQIFELYPDEWLTADDPSFPYYRLNHKAWKAALTKAAQVLGTSP